MLLDIIYSPNLNGLSEAIDWLLIYLPVLLPLAIIQVGLTLFAVIDIVKKRKTKNLNRIIWLLIVCLVNLIGPILYLILGRADAAVGDDDGGDDI